MTTRPTEQEAYGLSELYHRLLALEDETDRWVHSKDHVRVVTELKRLRSSVEGVASEIRLLLPEGVLPAEEFDDLHPAVCPACRHPLPGPLP